MKKSEKTFEKFDFLGRNHEIISESEVVPRANRGLCDRERELRRQEKRRESMGEKSS